MDFIKYLVLSLIFTLMSTLTLIGVFTTKGLSVILLIILTLLFITVGIYCLLSTLTFKLGKSIEATLVDKENIEYESKKNYLSTYYRYTFEVSIKEKNVLGQFRLYEKDQATIDNLNVGDIVTVKRLLGITKVSTSDIINKYKNK